MVDAIVSGVHEPGDSHYELLRAFTDDAVLQRMSAALADGGYRTHEFGDSVLMERLKRYRAGGTRLRQPRDGRDGIRLYDVLPH